ncbi:glycosyltransferase family 4 protein [Calothrix sp. 336/3]|uniref:glycosyltransferase family 4 protein n=1 Tax=Calothrix sp. 336/3 TaxID=1337936 RepID=UPI0004E3AAC5|nr:glycosyltransferase family 4 protein [Calothrix sp. 336/3]AKG21136.1 glycosyl transferase [Calothrix sp. 336/3]
MKALLINTYDLNGGAARAAYRLHKGLQHIGANSQMLVQEKSSDEKSILAPEINLLQGIAKARITLDSLPLKAYNQRKKNIFSLQWLPDDINHQINKIKPDIINLHWINSGLIQIETIAKFRQPVFWTLHDMWAFTGGCHYSGDCNLYQTSCNSCPELNSPHTNDLSSWVWQRKAKAWNNLSLTIISPSNWLAKCVSSSSLLKNMRVEVIPNGIDIQKYQPIKKQFAREILNLPQDRQLILFGSLEATNSQRKGFHLLQPALHQINQSSWKDKIDLVVFGASKPQNPPDFGLPIHYLGSFNDNVSLSLVYSAADVFVLPSVEDNLPNTIMEALSCGTPCAAFDIGGIGDMIEHEQNGYLASPYNTHDLAAGIIWILENQERSKKLSVNARETIEKKFTIEIQANRYLSLFDEAIITGNKS